MFESGLSFLIKLSQFIQNIHFILRTYLVLCVGKETTNGVGR